MHDFIDFEVRAGMAGVNKKPGVWARVIRKRELDDKGKPVTITGAAITHGPSRETRYMYENTKRTPRGCWRKCLEWLEDMEATRKC